MKTRLIAAVCALAAVGATPTAAQDVTLSGQVRPRYEYRDPVGGGKDGTTSMRVRLGALAEVDANLSVFVQLQDVRTWGEETHPLFDRSADQLDLHQGYLRYKGEKLDWLTATVGRMETNLGGQRLVGAVNWTQQAQSFDGVRLDLTGGWGDVKLLAYTIADETAPTQEVDKELYGAYATVKSVGPGVLDLYWLYDRVEGATKTDQHALGARYAFEGTVRGRVEATLETGTRAGADLSAFMVGARLGTSFAGGKASATLWYDYLSGDDPGTAEVEVFHTLYATNHKFYGFADLFLNIPVHTGGAGLQDLALKMDWRPESDVRVAADLHRFRTARGDVLASDDFGTELDLTLSHRYSPHLTATAGLSRVWKGDALVELGRLTKDMTWFYVMLDARF